MNTTLPISVVMCTFNGAKYLEEQLDSILSQTYTISEIIIVDDGSTDQTLDLLQNRSAQDKRIKVFINEARIGATRNFEKAFRLATNDWIAISDQDDIWHPRKIEKLVNAINRESMLVYCDSQRFKDEPDFSVKPDPKYRRFSGSDGRKILLFNTVSGHAMLFNKRLLNYLPALNDLVYYDWVMAMAAAYNGGVTYVAETLVLQRIHENNLSTGDDSQYSNSRNRGKFKQMVLHHLSNFVNTPNMNDNDRRMVATLFRLWKESIDKGLSVPLFFFLMKYRKQLFSFKNKKSLFVRHLKYCWWLCKN